VSVSDWAGTRLPTALVSALLLALAVVIAFGSENAMADSWQPASGHLQMPIWPGAIPDANPVPGSEEVTVVGPDEYVAGRRWLWMNESRSRP
jgi:hypothetical protein